MGFEPSMAFLPKVGTMRAVVFVTDMPISPWSQAIFA